MAMLIGAIGGCAAPMAPQPAAVSAADYQATFDAAAAVLLEAGFVIDRQDFRFGRITTKPRTSPTVWEIWNADNTTGEQALAASMGAERRVVTVKLEPAGVTGKSKAGEDIDAQPSPSPSLRGRGEYELTIEVVIERMQDPDRRITGATAGPRITRRLAATPAQWSDRHIPSRYYVAVARDPQMEGRLMAAVGLIRKRRAEPGVE